MEVNTAPAVRQDTFEAKYEILLAFVERLWMSTNQQPVKAGVLCLSCQARNACAFERESYRQRGHHNTCKLALVEKGLTAGPAQGDWNRLPQSSEFASHTVGPCLRGRKGVSSASGIQPLRVNIIAFMCAMTRA